MLSLFILLSFIVLLLKFTSVFSSLNGLSSITSFSCLSCVLFISFQLFYLFFSSIETAREKHSCVTSGTKYSRSPTSTKPSLPTSNPLWLPGVFHLLITMVIILHLHCSPYLPLHVQLFPTR
ncbi:unnamed protein product [Gulo gulo]|uniref:Uncharacterized protein n=1 Tax=Gulo gulo TaxID=48420 RepID=A0A9X9M3A1_GULGU|nr:unnamed protein product [Gulo gulo]